MCRAWKQKCSAHKKALWHFCSLTLIFSPIYRANSGGSWTFSFDLKLVRITLNLWELTGMDLWIFSESKWMAEKSISTNQNTVKWTITRSLESDYATQFVDKPVYVIIKQQRCRSACASAQYNQCLCCSLSWYYNTYTCWIQNFKTSSVSVAEQAGFESDLVENPVNRYSLDTAHMSLFFFFFLK